MMKRNSILRDVGIAAGVLAAVVVVSSAYALSGDRAFFDLQGSASHAKPSKEGKQTGLHNAQEKSGKSKGRQLTNANAGKKEHEKGARGSKAHVEAIAHQFGMSTEDVLTLHEEGFGFGAIVKLAVLARAKHTGVKELAASLPRAHSEPEPDYGALFDGLSPEEKARIEGLPKNFGHIKSHGTGKTP